MPLRKEIIQETLDLARHISATTSDSKLTMIQLRTVVFIAKHGTVKPTEIAKEFLITPATVTSQIDNLVRDGWIKRKYNKKDRRVIEVTLTEKAKKELPIEVENTLKSYEWIFDVLTDDEQECLLDVLKRVHKNAHKQ
jgi:DNA-binding MarR family transcriptional regulator